MLAAHILGMVAAYRAIRTARTAQGAVAWVLFLTVVPYVGVPLFVFFGHARFPGLGPVLRGSGKWVRRLRAFRQAHPAHVTGRPGEVGRCARAFERLAEMQAVSGNSARLLVDGDATFEAIFEAIDGARSYVLVMTYVLRDDELGRAFRERLIERARRGCTVRLLYDGLGSHGLPEAYLDELRAAGVVATNFHSIRQPHSRLQINFRNHRKIVVVDGETGFTGGLNIADEYVGRSAYFGHWRDTHLRLEGPVVAQLQLIFAEDWHWATDEWLKLHWRPRPQGDNADVLVLAPGPADPLETGSLYFCQAIGAARRRLWITSPYFVPDLDVLSALKLAALRGVDVRILVADRCDHWLVWLAAYAYFDEVRDAGVKILRYRDGFMHQKVILIDDELASVGSVNLDNRSCRLNFEVTALIFDKPFAAKVAAMIETDLAGCVPYETRLEELPSRLRRYGAPVARLFAPVL